MDQRLNILDKTRKLLEENTGRKRHDTEFVSDFLDIPKAQATNEKIDKLDYIKILNFCASREKAP